VSAQSQLSNKRVSERQSFFERATFDNLH
jgi:hypothetical protein